MNEQIQFELVSPEEKLVSQPVKMAVIPGEEGEIGVGAGHMSLVSSLKPGVLKLYESTADSKPRRIFIAGGFADITGTNCTVLAEEATDVKNLKQAEIEQKIKDLNEDLTMAQEPADKARINARLIVEKAKIQAITGKIAA